MEPLHHGEAEGGLEDRLDARLQRRIDRELHAIAWQRFLADGLVGADGRAHAAALAAQPIVLRALDAGGTGDVGAGLVAAKVHGEFAVSHAIQRPALRILGQRLRSGHADDARTDVVHGDAERIVATHVHGQAVAWQFHDRFGMRAPPHAAVEHGDRARRTIGQLAEGERGRIIHTAQHRVVLRLLLHGLAAEVGTGFLAVEVDAPCLVALVLLLLDQVDAIRDGDDRLVTLGGRHSADGDDGVEHVGPDAVPGHTR